MKPLMTVDTINALMCDLAHDINLNEKEWIIPALRSHVHNHARNFWSGYEIGRCDRYISQWIASTRRIG